jgi:hypothetical protein
MIHNIYITYAYAAKPAVILRGHDLVIDLTCDAAFAIIDTQQML